MSNEIKIDVVGFGSDIQETVPESLFYSSIVGTAQSTVQKIITAVSFVPPLPGDVTVIPLLIVFPVNHNFSQGGNVSASWSQGAGTPFNGTEVGFGVYRDVEIDDQITVSSSADGAGFAVGTWLFLAILRK